MAAPSIRTTFAAKYIAAALLLVATLTLAPAGLAAAAPGSPPASTLVVSERPSTIRPHGSTIVTGTLLTAASRARIGGVYVELWVRPVGAASWTHVQNTVTNGLGDYAFGYPAAQSSVLQTRYPGSASHGPAVSGSLVLRVANGFDAIFMRGCGLDNNAYTDIAAVGRTNPGAAGTVATLQGGLYFSGFGYSWNDLASTVVAADGSFTATADNPGGQNWDFRWVLQSSINVAEADSPVYLGVSVPAVPGCYAFPVVSP